MRTEYEVYMKHGIKGERQRILGRVVFGRSLKCVI